jgi:RimJ/RimL family protein N-acetyltransferase
MPDPAPANSRPIMLRGDLVGLGRILRSDVPTMAAWFDDPAYSTHLGNAGMYLTDEAEAKWYDDSAAFKETSQQFAIVELATGRHVGNCGLFACDPRKQHATLGIGIGDPAARGRGLGTEAVRLLCEYGFYFRNLWHIGLAVAAFNEAGIRAYRKAGFREVGRYTGRWVMGGQRFDEVLMELTRDEVDLTRVRKTTPNVDAAWPGQD